LPPLLPNSGGKPPFLTCSLLTGPVNPTYTQPLRLLFFQAVGDFQDLLGSCTDPVILRQVNPNHGARGVDQKLCRARDVFTIRTCTRVHQIITSSQFRISIGKKRESVTSLLHEIA